LDYYQQHLLEETTYLEKTLAFIKKELDEAAELSASRKTRLIASRKDMWENTVHHVHDFSRLTEINQYLAEVNYQAADYQRIMKKIKKYKKMIGSPYFGRFDFLEEGFDHKEKI